MNELTETRWTRYGKDRVYVRTAAGVDVGYIDLHAKRVVPALSEYEPVLRHSLARWCPPVEAPEPPTAAMVSPAVPVPTCRPPADLATNSAGAAARAKRDEVNAEAPVRNLLARVLGVKTDERSWRVGAEGEEKVAAQLARLGDRWRCLHSVEVGNRGSDIDHVVIGPPGVFTLNAKRHPGGKAWVGERAVLINGRKTHYLRNSRFEAERVARLLSDACGFPVAVKPVIVFVDLGSYTVEQKPDDVEVLTRRRLAKWLRSQRPALDAGTVETIYMHARWSTTWKKG